MNKEQRNYGLLYVYVLLFSNWFDNLDRLFQWPNGSVDESCAMYDFIDESSCQ